MHDDLRPPTSHHAASPLAWTVAIAGPVVVSLLLVPLRGEIRTSNESLVLVLVVVAAAALGGRLTGAVAALVSMASFDLFFTRPYGSFTINSRFEGPPFREDLPELTHQGVRLPATDVDASAPGRVALPVYGAGHPIGRFVLELEQGTTGIQLPAEDRALAVALADQLGTVLANEIQH